MQMSLPQLPLRAGERWLPDMDLNHDKQIQSLLCYRYTIGQTGALKVSFRPAASRLQVGQAASRAHLNFRTRRFPANPLSGWSVYSNGTPQDRLFFSGAAGVVPAIWTRLAAPLKNKLGLGGVWIYKQATPNGVKKGSLAAQQLEAHKLGCAPASRSRLAAGSTQQPAPAQLNLSYAR
jgi:hypothetical protein